MLRLNIPAMDLWDEFNERFIQTDGGVLELEHSLLAISKWEAKYEKPFLTNTPKTQEETLDYIRCMTLNSVNPNIYFAISNNDIEAINKYNDKKSTATFFGEKNKPARNRQQITSELIYYWMASYRIPFEAQTWHINRLLTLIRIFNEENKPHKKQNMKDVYARNKALNEARRKRSGSKG